MLDFLQKRGILLLKFKYHTQRRLFFMEKNGKKVVIGVIGSDCHAVGNKIIHHV